MNIHLLNEMIEELENYRQSMHFKELFGSGKIEPQKNLERIINQAKQEKAMLEGSK